MREINQRRWVLGFLTVTISLGMVLISSACGQKDEAIIQAEAHEKNAAAFLDKADFAAAIEEYTLAITQNPKSDRAYEGRGIAYTEMKEYDLAVADLTKAIELAPDRGGLYFERGIIYSKQGNLDAAIADFSRAIGDRSKTRWRSALLERGLVYKAKGNLIEARADFERIVQLEVERPGEADKAFAERAQEELAELGR